MSQPLSIGIIGAGNVAATIHLPVLLAMPEVRVVWVCDKDTTRARQVADSYRIPHSPINPLPPADVVLLSTPYGAREPYYQELAARSTAVLVEKPFARTVEEHQRLCALFAPNRLACGLNRRAMGLATLCQEFIATGLFGPLQRARFGFGSLGGITTRGGYTSNLALAGGGLLLESGVHGIDLMHFILQACDTKLLSGNVILDEGLDIHAEGTYNITTSSGAAIPIDIEVTRLRNTANRVEFEFENATVHFPIFSLEGGSNIFIQPRGAQRAYTLRNHEDNYPYTWQQIAAEFWRTFLTGLNATGPNYTLASQSLLTTHAVEQLYARAPSTFTGSPA